MSKASTPSPSNGLTSCVPNNEHHIAETNKSISLDVGILPTPSKSKVLPSSPQSSHPSCSPSILGLYPPTSFQPSILGPYIPYLYPPPFPSILGLYIPNMNPLSPPSILGPPPSLPSILGPCPSFHPSIFPNYMPLYLIFQFVIPSPQIHQQDHQRHSSLNPLQPSNPITPSIIPPYHPCSCSHTMANKSILDAKIKKHKSKNPQQSKSQHVPSKIHVPKEKRLIPIKEKFKRP